MLASPIAVFAASCVAAAFIVRLLASAPFARLAVDRPNGRSLHVAPVPRTGGLGLFLGAGAAWTVSAHAFGLTAALAAVLVIVFLIDDIRGLPIGLRLAVQCAVAAMFVAGTGLGPVLLWPLLAIGIVWCMNLYNFMDGTDGLAGGMAVIGFGAYVIAALAAGVDDVAAASAVVAGAALGFLIWNFQPARIFLGDAGSVPLGFLAAAVGLAGWQREAWPAWFPLLVFSPFLLDASVTLLQRAWRREPLWHAHRSHYYQRLVRMGWSHRMLALVAYGLMIFAAAAALLVREAPTGVVAALLSAWSLAYFLIAASIDQRWRAFARREQQNPNTPC